MSSNLSLLQPEPELDETGAVRDRQIRILEALVFSSAEPVGESDVRPFLGEEADIGDLFAGLQTLYADRGVNLVKRAGKWAFRTAPDLAMVMHREQIEKQPMSRAALETLAIIAYHQPATRAEIEEVRGVATGRGTLDILMEAGFVRMRGRRRSPGRPVTFGTTEAFLDHFGLETVTDLPGLEDLKGAGLLSGQLPSNMQVPLPFDGPLREDEEPLDSGDSGDSGELE